MSAEQRLRELLENGDVNELADLIRKFNLSTNVSETKNVSDGGDENYEYVATSEVTLVSHTHGRRRRQERGIQRRELQAAIKYGRKERANPGPMGQVRWKYTHKGVVYITDESRKHEITSWRLDEEEKCEFGEDVADDAPCESVSSHTVIVVDHSGSMRKGDVPGYSSRTEAVYDCLAREFLKPQLENKMLDMSDAVVSLIEMSDTARVVFRRRQIDQNLLKTIESRKNTRARSHGNYLPALEEVLKLLRSERNTSTKLMLVFLSDGAPSDHIFEECEHGVQVWREGDPSKFYKKQGKYSVALQKCGSTAATRACRKAIKTKQESECLRLVRHLGDMFGRDRTIIGTVAFGDPEQSYRMLELMANELPRGSFQKLGLQVGGLKTALSSLTTSLTTLRTEGSTRSLTIRSHKKVDKKQGRIASGDAIRLKEGWEVYFDVRRLESKGKRAIPSYFQEELGIAFRTNPFGEGVERFAFKCCRVRRNQILDSRRGDLVYMREGPWFIAKESKHHENMRSSKFQMGCLRNQKLASEFANRFNRQLGGEPSWQIRFLKCEVHEIRGCNQYEYPDGTAWVLLEMELEGKFCKWNNNNGGVRKAVSRLKMKGMDKDSKTDSYDIDELPQAFSHFSYSASNYKKLVCDLQGVHNKYDGFQFTDPAILTNNVSGRQSAGATDKGLPGIKRFFETHKCGFFCKRLGLTMPTFSR